MRPAFRIAVTVALTLTSPGWAGEQTAGGVINGPAGFCFTNLAGLGICGGDALCPNPSTASCDDANACPDGEVCMITCCPSNLTGICFPPTSADAGCSNPGTCGDLSACSPVVFHEDFTGGLGKLSTGLVCGSGGSIFVEDSCADSTGASSPLDHARWGLGPASCGGYGSASHRYVASTSGVDVSGCDRAVLDFDYLFELEEDGNYDRGFVTVQLGGGAEKVVASNQPVFSSVFLSCAGAILPIGNLESDGEWHHYRAGVGDGSTVVVRFYGDTYDWQYNDRQGWLFDDVRIDCGELIYGNGFEGGNTLSWSTSTAPPPLITVDQAGACGTYLPCDGPAGNCVNFEIAEGTTYCLGDHDCNTGCTDSGDCPPDEFCIVNSCCGGSVCAPATCPTTGSLFRRPAGPSAARPGNQ
jgi:hypothetical protein